MNRQHISEASRKGCEPDSPPACSGGAARRQREAAAAGHVVDTARRVFPARFHDLAGIDLPFAKIAAGHDVAYGTGHPAVVPGLPDNPGLDVPPDQHARIDEPDLQAQAAALGAEIVDYLGRNALGYRGCMVAGQGAAFSVAVSFGHIMAA